jgi:hypothetical protein
MLRGSDPSAHKTAYASGPFDLQAQVSGRNILFSQESETLEAALTAAQAPFSFAGQVCCSR